MNRKYKISKVNILVIIEFVLLTLACSKGVLGLGLGNVFEYVAYALLLTHIIMSFIIHKRYFRKTHRLALLVFLLLLQIVGIVLQNLTAYRKVVLMYTIIAILVVALMSDYYIKNKDGFLCIACGCLLGIVLSILLAIAVKEQLVYYGYEDTFGFNWSFNFGIRDKNAATIFMLINICFYIYFKSSIYKHPVQYIIYVFNIVMMLPVNSRGAMVYVVIFIITINLDEIIRLITSHQRKIVVALGTLAGANAIYSIYINIILRSATYRFRYNGLINYFLRFKNDTFHMVFGCAELIYDKTEDYTRAYRALTGWNGSLEMAWLNMLIKSGLLGVLAYVILFLFLFKYYSKLSDKKIKQIYFTIAIIMLASSLVATYIQTVHSVFGIFCYLTLGYCRGECERMRKSFVNIECVYRECVYR